MSHLWLKMCPLLKRSHPHERDLVSPYHANMVAARWCVPSKTGGEPAEESMAESSAEADFVPEVVLRGR